MSTKDSCNMQPDARHHSQTQTCVINLREKLVLLSSQTQHNDRSATTLHCGEDAMPHILRSNFNLCNVSGLQTNLSVLYIPAVNNHNSCGTQIRVIRPECACHRLQICLPNLWWWDTSILYLVAQRTWYMLVACHGRQSCDVPCAYGSLTAANITGRPALPAVEVTSSSLYVLHGPDCIDNNLCTSQFAWL